MAALILILLNLHCRWAITPEGEVRAPRPGVELIAAKRKFLPPVRFYERDR